MNILPKISTFRNVRMLRRAANSRIWPRRPLRIEGLEDRRVPAVLAFNEPAGALAYTAGANVANNLTIAYNAGRYTLSDVEPIHYIGYGLDGVVGNHTPVISFSAANVDSIMAALGNGADRASVRSINDPLVLDAGEGNDIVDVLATARAVTILGGVGDDWIQVGQRYGQPHADLDGIRAPVRVLGQGGNDTLWVSDFDNGGVTPPIYDFTPHTYWITSTAVQRDGAAATFYDGSLENVRLNAGYGNDVVNVWSTAAGTEYTVSGKAGGRDTINVGSPGGTLDTILGRVTVLGEQGVGGPPIDVVNLYDQADLTANTYVVAPDAVRRNGVEVLAYRNMERLTLNAGTGHDRIFVEGVGTTATATRVTVNGGGGDDQFAIGRLGSLDAIISPLSVNGQGGIDTLTFDDRADLNENIYLLSSSALGRSGPGNVQYNIFYTGMESLTLYAGMASDRIFVSSTPPTASVMIYAGGGNDEIHVGDQASGVAGIRGQLFIHGQTHTAYDTLFVHGPGEYVRIPDFGSPGQILRNGVVLLSYLGIERFFLGA